MSSLRTPQTRPAGRTASALARARLRRAIDRASRVIEIRMRRALRPHQMTPTRYDVLAVVFSDPRGVGLARLARVLGLPPARLRVVVQDLAAAGLILPARRTAPVRHLRLRLTRAGEHALLLAATEEDAILADVFAALPDAQIPPLIDRLHRIAAALPEPEPEA